ncbi:hypothetical protein EYF80_062497 [Liparis tanakae]|uniref:Uncharacterized protein n=1 Tax=Liparis tanakae TaxID=230148 RepID=A0A4Z2EFQ1_9TELE|nr:hypothetical protein EYF80_062497 [Liparis tanakae]
MLALVANWIEIDRAIVPERTGRLAQACCWASRCSRDSESFRWPSGRASFRRRFSCSTFNICFSTRTFSFISSARFN